MSGGVGFLGSGFSYRSEAIQHKMRGHGSPPGGWPTGRKPSRPKMPPQASKVKTKVLRAGELMVVDPEEVYEGDEVVGEVIEAQLGPGWDYEAEGWEDGELAGSAAELESGTLGLPAAGWAEIGWAEPAGLLEAGTE